MTNSTHSLIRKTAQIPPPADALTETIRAAVAADREILLDKIAEMFDERPPETLLDNEGVCQLLGITGPTLRRLRAQGLPHLTLGSMHRYERKSILNFLGSRKAAHREEPK